MSYHLFKSLHFIGVITWFAGLFYIVRLFIYDTEAQSRPKSEAEILTSQFKIMEKRLWYGITWPACIFTWIMGSFLAFVSGQLTAPWFHFKLAVLLILQVYHFSVHAIFKRIQNNSYPLSSTQLRIHNEVATLLMVVLVFLAVYKSALNMAFAIVGFFVFAVLLMGAIRFYKRRREISDS